MDNPNKKYLAEVYGEWLPIYAPTLEEALGEAELEYGADNVQRVRPEVTHAS